MLSKLGGVASKMGGVISKKDGVFKPNQKNSFLFHKMKFLRSSA